MDERQFYLLCAVVADLDDDRDEDTGGFSELLSTPPAVADGSGGTFDGHCPMCGQSYGSYTTHLQRCQPR